MKFFLILSLSVFAAVGMPCQTIAQVNLYKMNTWQDSLIRLGTEMYENKAEAKRLEKNFIFVKTLVASLKERHSFLYNFDQLDMISVVMSPDSRFRIFSWNIPLHDGSYLYYGAIQSHTEDGTLKLVPLLDKTFEINDPEGEALTPSVWYGAQYYSIVPLTGNRYALLGWKGHAPNYSQKVIEILQCEPNSFVLGGAIFSDSPTMFRKIFNFARDLSMYLKYDQQKSRIVFDHIVPADPSLQGQYSRYGPDLSYDAYLLKNGKLILQQDVPFQNEERGNRDDLVQPGQATSGKKSGL
ncbi:hypothetical protein [Sphingobacterium suaedae]|uniref:Uncharacterized protein n=1 Tax=Sphingobacterium suaedae TaxID=1686402 RepID=A0ABW5KDJ4_9SPHI